MLEYEIDIEKAKEYLAYLDEKYTEWYTSNKKERSRIEDEIRTVADMWDDTIYICLNQGRASGLFEPGFFESDLRRSLQILKQAIMEATEQEKHLKALYQKLEKYNINPEKVKDKTLQDFLISKKEEVKKNGGIITLDDDEIALLEGLTEGRSVDWYDFLEKILDEIVTE